MTSIEETSRGAQPTNGVNVSDAERWASGIGGSALALYGLRRGSVGGVTLALLGGALVYRGVTGHCPAYGAVGVSTAGNSGDDADGAGSGIHVEQSVTIARPAEEIYRFWRDFESLPRFMTHLEAVNEIGDGRSHWVAKAPLGATVEWDAEITEDTQHEAIAWRSLEGADIENAGSVRFERALDGHGTVLRVSLDYRPPAGKLGAAIARLFGEEPEQQVRDDLDRFKQLMEAGELPTTEGQASEQGAPSPPTGSETTGDAPRTPARPSSGAGKSSSSRRSPR